MPQNDQRIYRTFEEFEREELRRADSVSTSVDDMITTLFRQELEALDFEAPRKRPSPWEDDDE
jgi:hypothetical protein